VYTLLVRASFDASHVIPGHQGKCAQLHGHTYKVEAEFVGDSLNEIGMLADFGDLRRELESVLPDHAHLNEIMAPTPTAENIAHWLFERLDARGLPIEALTLWETERYGCRYSVPRRHGSEGGC
jgi:6-pyruvoyltetrahydropterin/6-carboxytetrahydropterin synthase